MSSRLGWKVFIVLAVLIWSVVYIMPNFKPELLNNKYFPGKKVVYGLDIQGGIHLVMGVDIPGVVSEQTRRMISTLSEKLEKDNIKVKSSNTAPLRDNVSIKLDFDNDNHALAAQRMIEKDFINFTVLGRQNTLLEIQYNDVYLKELKKRILDQSIETIRNRIDEFGVAEPSITAQGEDRILVQLPGIEDSSNAKNLINRTAHLEFLVVDTKVDMTKVVSAIEEAEKKGNYSLDKMKYSEYIKRLNEDIKNIVGNDNKVLFEKAQNAESMEMGKQPYVVKSLAALTGDDLKSAQIAYSERNEPQVAMSFNPMGAKKFADLTGANVGGFIAIVLDDVIYAAPRVNERIGGGEAVVSLGNRNYQAALNEANLISMALRAGALPAKLEQLEERTVGPSLGQDSIDKAQTAVYVGLALVFIFMAVYYKTFGLIANFALVFNGVLILAILTAFNATLTLPGVAGIALTLGMAVDANVIIYERIREELQRGFGMDVAIREGYDKAMSAILDSNITTIGTSALLMYFGTGAVRGFGATLIIGLISSMFTAIFVTKTIAEFLLYKVKVKKIHV